MKQYKYNGNIGKLIKQNCGEVIDCIEGCLLDDLLVSCKRGMMALLETYQNAWQSVYTVYFSTNESEIWDLWESRQIAMGVDDEY